MCEIHSTPDLGCGPCLLALLDAMPAECRRCHQAPAEPRGTTVVQLCAECADEMYPGADHDAYHALVTRYGWAAA